MNGAQVCRIMNEIDVAEARRRAKQLAESMQFSKVRTYRLMTAVSELGNNLVFHATRGGVIGLETVFQRGRVGIAVKAEDEGPGIVDLELAMQDGFSTAGGLGSGLPGTRRLLDEFSIYSKMGEGTRVTGLIWSK